jgi:hypothetical protein
MMKFLKLSLLVLSLGTTAAARGLAGAFPTQTHHMEDDVTRKLAGVKPAVFS